MQRRTDPARLGSDTRSRAAHAARARGVALVLVVVVLAALMAIAAPFVLSMRLQERSADGFNAEVRAEMAARAGRELAVSHLMGLHHDPRRRAAEAQGQLTQSPEDWLDLAEIQPELTDLTGQHTFRLRDPQGTIVDVRVEDEQGKLHLTGAPATALANLLGATMLLEEVTEDSDQLIVEDASRFFSDGDPTTLDGLLWMESGELIAYRDILPEPWPERPGQVRWRFEGLVRGAYLSTPDPRQMRHAAQSVVRDGRGLKLGLHPFWARLGDYTPFRTVQAAREIANWTLLDPFLAQLFRRGFSLEDLRELGLGGDQVKAYGAHQALDERAEAERRATAPREPGAAEAEAPAGEAAASGNPDEDGAPAQPAFTGRGRARGTPPEMPSGDRVGPGDAERVVDQARRRLGRKGAEAWLEDALKRADVSNAQQRAFGDLARDLMAQRAAFERRYFQRAREDLDALAQVRDIEVLGAREHERMRPYITVHSARSSEWAGGAVTLNEVAPDPDESTSTLFLGIHIVEARPGSVARIEGPSGFHAYRQIAAYQRGAQGRPHRLDVFPQLEGSHRPGSLRVFVAPVHPVNVNSAPREVLEAVMTGLALGRGQSVTPAEAASVAAELVSAPIEGPQELTTRVLGAVGAAGVRGSSAQAILANALDPSNQQLRGRTVPFVYRSGGVFTVESTGIANGPTGVELARRRVRDVVAVTPPREVSLHVDSQLDFFPSFRHPDTDLVSHFQDGRRGNLLETWPEPLPLSFPMGMWPNRSHEPGVGRVRPATGEAGGEIGQGGLLVLDHFRQQRDGQRVSGGGHMVGPPPLVADPYGTWPTEVLAPGWIETWVQIANPSGVFPLLDVGQRDQSDRVLLLFDGSARQLIFQAFDAALEPIPCVEVRAPFQPEPNVWYHIAACWKGTRPGDLALFVDGQLVGDDITEVRLTGAIGASDASIPVTTTAGFAPRGAIRVGSEVVEYDAISGNSFVVRDVPPPTPAQAPAAPTGRGARGTVAMAHDMATPVTVWGYTNFFVGTIPGLPFDLAQIRRGGSTLAHPLPRETPMAAIMPLGGAAQGLVYENETSIPTVPSGPSLADRGFPPRGFLQIHHELVYYDRLSPYAFEDCVRLVYGWIQDDQMALVPPLIPPSPIAGYRAYTPIVLASIEVVNATDYENLDMLPGGGRGDILRGFWVAVNGASPAQKEWMRYRKAASLPNPVTGAPDPRWENILICCDTAMGFGLQPNSGGRTNAVSPGDRQWPRADGFQPDGPAKFQELLGRLQAVSGGTIPPLFLPGHMHIGMEWGRNLFRANGLAMDHPAGAAVIPAHALTRPYSGAEDRVTIFDAQPLVPERAEMLVYEAIDQPTLLLPGGNAQRLPFSFVAFVDFLPLRPYQTSLGLRLVKRPSGELPLFAPTTLAIGGPRQEGIEPTATAGTLEGFLDEVRVGVDETNRNFTLQAEGQIELGGAVAPETMPAVAQLGQIYHQARRGPRPQAAPFRAGDASVPLKAGWQGIADGINRDGLVVKVGSEAMAFGRFQSPQLTDIERGVLGTLPVDHSSEASLYVLPFPPLVRLAGGIGERGRLTYTGAQPHPSHLPRRGYLMLDARQGGGVQELLPYEPDRGRAVRLPLDDRHRPAYRGGFGTARDSALEEGRIAFVWPYRFHDRFQVGVESDDGVFFQTSFQVPGGAGAASAVFRSVAWDEIVTGADARAWVIARVDGRPAWDSEPTNRPGGLYRFDNATADNRIDAVGRSIEVRVVFPFLPNAYQRGGWKQTREVTGVRVRYVMPVVTLSSEDAS